MDLDKIRADLPLYSNKLFFNSAGASLMPRPVVDEINFILREEEKYGGYKIEDIYKEKFETFYQSIASLINANERNIAFTHDATDAFIKAISSIHFKSGDVVLTSEVDYSSNQIIFLSLAQRYNIRIVRIKSLENGDLDIEHLKGLLEEHEVKLVTIAHIPTNSGTIQDVETVGEICSNYDTIYLVDACQSIGQISVDIDKIKCDFLTATGRKFLRGPRGTGFLYVSDRILEQGYHPLMIDCFGASWVEANDYIMKESARRFETWERPFALVAGLAVAIDYLNEIGIKAVEEYNKNLMELFRNAMAQIDGFTVYDRGSKKSNILTFRKNDLGLEELADKLEKHDVLFTLSSATSGIIDYNKKGIDGAVRLSPHYFNTDKEINDLLTIIGNL